MKLSYPHPIVMYISVIKSSNGLKLASNKYYMDDQMKEDDMGMTQHSQVQGEESLKGRDKLEDLVYKFTL
jgi:hypothetical protein